MRHTSRTHVLLLTTLVSLLVVAQGFAPVRSSSIPRSRSDQEKAIRQSLPWRGGASPLALTSSMEKVASVVSSSLQSGPAGVVALSALAAAVCLPISQYKSLYVISVGYGLSVALIGSVLLQVFAPVVASPGYWLNASMIFYGVRLATFLWYRDVTARPIGGDRKEPARLKRIPLALSVALFYATETTPVLYALRNPVGMGGISGYIAWAGVGLAWAGALLEAVADLHKFLVKKKSADDSNRFQGPTGGAFSFTRHPNYTGEVLFWFGIFVGGIPSIRSSVVGVLSSLAGLGGIVSIMRGATKGLEKRQAEKYGGDDTYEAWKTNVPYALFPFVKSAPVTTDE